MKVNVVICGAIRDRFDFLMILQKILRKRDEGIINEIVLSTWIGEIDLYSDLREILYRSGINIVENRSINQSSIGNILQQQRCLESGLIAIEDKSQVVLKIRTDKCYHLLDPFFRYIENNEKLQKVTNGVFESRILVQMASVSIPFLIADKVFLGNHTDLRKLTLHTDFYENSCIFHKNLGAENRWFLMPFIVQYPIIRDYVANVNLRRVSTLIVDAIINKQSLQLPQTIKSFFEFYYKVLYENFLLVGDVNYNQNGWSYFESSVQDENHFLIEDRGIRKDLHAKSQDMLAAFSSFYYHESYAQKLFIDEFDSFIDESLAENRTAIRLVTRNSIDKTFSLTANVIAYLPVSADARSFLSMSVIQLLEKRIGAQEIYYRSASKLLAYDKNKFIDDIIILLKNAAKSKHSGSLYLLYNLLKDSKDSTESEFAQYCLREAANRGSKEAADILKAM